MILAESDIQCIHEARHQVGHSEWRVVAGTRLIREPVSLEIEGVDRIVAGELVEDETPGEDIGADAVDENQAAGPNRPRGNGFAGPLP